MKIRFLSVVRSCVTLKLLGFVEDEKGNEAARFGAAGIIGKSELLGAVALVVPTNEEFVIAQQSVELL